MNMPPAKQKKPLSTGVLVAVILGSLVILAIGTAAFFFLHYRQTASQHIDSSQSQVIISQPQDMAQFPVGSFISVDVSAIGFEPFTSTELWINGVLEGVQAGPSGGSSALSTVYTWIPLEAGNYSLVARAITKEGKVVTSPAVIVIINPPETEIPPTPEGGGTAQVPQVVQVVQPASPEGYSSPLPPTSMDIPVPAVKWKGSPGDWLTHLITTVPPAAPELTAIADGCNVKLDIHDLSENEEGFTLYRHTSINENWVLVSNIAAHSGTGWIGYLDENISGGVEYYATAFNSKGESSSNLVMVNIDPEICPQGKPPFAVPILRLKIENLQLDGAAGNIYCYRSLGNGLWSRWPDLGFLSSDGAEKMIPQLIDPLVLSDLSDSGAIPAEPLDLKLECWGWEGGRLLSLGRLQQKIDLKSPNKIQAAFPGLAFEISPNILSGPNRQLFPLGNDEMPPVDIEELGYMPESDQMPIILAHISDDPNECKEHILDPAEKDLFCQPMPGFSEGPGGVNPQLYLIWRVIDGVCQASLANSGKECLPLAWWQAFAEKYPDPYSNAPVVFRVMSKSQSGGGFGWSIDADQYAMRITPDFPPAGDELCYNGKREFEVDLVVFTSIDEFIGGSFNNPQIPCPKLLGDQIYLTVTFNQMTISNMVDGPATNVFGRFYANIDGVHGDYLQAGWMAGAQPSPGDSTNGYIETLGNGTYNLANFQLCRNFTGCFNGSPNFMLNNNVLHATVNVSLSGYDTLQIASLFSTLGSAEPSPNSIPVPLCSGYFWLGPMTSEQWAGFNNEHFTITQSAGVDTCSLDVIVNSESAYYQE